MASANDSKVKSRPPVSESGSDSDIGRDKPCSQCGTCITCGRPICEESANGNCTYSEDSGDYCHTCRESYCTRCYKNNHTASHKPARNTLKWRTDQNIRQMLDRKPYKINHLWHVTRNRWSQSVPVEGDILKMLDLPVWEGNVKPRDVMENPEKYPVETKAIHAASFEHPILIANGHDVLDGLHRLAKAVLTKRPTLEARRVDYMDVAQVHSLYGL